MLKNKSSFRRKSGYKIKINSFLQKSRKTKNKINYLYNM